MKEKLITACIYPSTSCRITGTLTMNSVNKASLSLMLFEMGGGPPGPALVGPPSKLPSCFGLFKVSMLRSLFLVVCYEEFK